MALRSSPLLRSLVVDIGSQRHVRILVHGLVVAVVGMVGVLPLLFGGLVVEGVFRVAAIIQLVVVVLDFVLGDFVDDADRHHFVVVCELRHIVLLDFLDRILQEQVRFLQIRYVVVLQLVDRDHFLQGPLGFPRVILAHLHTSVTLRKGTRVKRVWSRSW